MSRQIGTRIEQRRREGAKGGRGEISAIPRFMFRFFQRYQDRRGLRQDLLGFSRSQTGVWWVTEWRETWHRADGLSFNKA